MISILCVLIMGFALGALGLLGLYIAMVLAIGLACTAAFGPFMLADAYKGWLSK